MNCSHCKAKHKEVDLFKWDIWLCAAGRRRRVFRLCGACDVALNRHMLVVMGDKDVVAKINKYEAEQRS